jgi:glutamate formiminotransferase / 5-formyltetrahydrofolate cyclo-ligase
VFECVVNISEGRNTSLLRDLSATTGQSLRDLHSDEFHNRSVFTLINTSDQLVADAHSLIAASFERLDLRHHEGVHPRFGVVDVIPYVALDPRDADGAVDLRDATAQWIGNDLGVPVFLYGPLAGPVGANARTLPDVRRGAFTQFSPDFGPSRPSPSLGACALGARPVLIAWNLWLRGVALNEARGIANVVRRAEVRVLAFSVGAHVQVSCNLIAPEEVGPQKVYDEVARLLHRGEIVRAELVGLLPRSVLEKQDHERWAQLGLSDDQTIESRLAEAG